MMYGFSKVSAGWPMMTLNMLKRLNVKMPCYNLRHLRCQALRIPTILHDGGILVFLHPQMRIVRVYTLNWMNNIWTGRNTNLGSEQIVKGREELHDCKGFKTDCSRLCYLPRQLPQQNLFSVWSWQDFRCFSSKANRHGKAKGKKEQTVSEETDSDSDDSYDMDDLERDWDPEIDGKVGVDSEEKEEGGVVKDWKDIQQNVPSLRVDAVLSTGLGVSRRKIEDAFLTMRLRINGEKVMKKSRQVNKGDILDVILERSAQAKVGEDERMSVMRVHVLEIGLEKTGKGRVPVLVRRWKNLQLKENE